MNESNANINRLISGAIRRVNRNGGKNRSCCIWQNKNMAKSRGKGREKGGEKVRREIQAREKRMWKENFGRVFR